MADVHVLEATLAHAVELAPRLRAADAAEVRASGGYAPLEALEVALASSAVAGTLLIDGQVAAMFGACAVSGTRNLGVAWALTGQMVDRHRREFMRVSREQLHQLLRIWPFLVNRVDARYEPALRWARWLGASVGPPVPFGVEKRPFHTVLFAAGRVLRHAHSAAAECTPACPAHDPTGWRCSRCGRQRPMMADTEEWPFPLCDECFTAGEVQRV